MAVNVRVVNKRGFEQMMKAFRRACLDRGHMTEWKEHAFYEKPSEKRRNKARQLDLEKKKQAAQSKRK